MASFEKRGNKVKAVVFIDGKKQSKTFPAHKDAEVWARAQERRRDLGEVIQLPTRDLFGTIIDRYTDDDGRWSADKAQHLEKIKQGLGHLPISKLTRSVFVDHIVGMKASPGRSAARMSFLSVVLNHAKIIYHLNVPMAEFTEARQQLAAKKITGRSRARTRRTTGEEIDLIAKNFTTDYRAIDLPAILEILTVLPIRVGELLGIKWGDITHGKNPTVLLRGRKHPDPRVKETNDEVVPLLRVGGKDTYQLLVTNRKKYGNQDGPFPYRVQAVSNAFAKARDWVGVKDLRVHDLRAHAISAMLEADVEPPMVMLISGHKDAAVFYRHYVRLDIEKVRRNIERKMAA